MQRANNCSQNVTGEKQSGEICFGYQIYFSYVYFRSQILLINLQKLKQCGVIITLN